MIREILRKIKIPFFKEDKSISNRLEKKTKLFLKRQKAIWRFLKKRKLHQLPIFIFLGPKASGKTTLLLNSDIKFVFEKKVQPTEQAAPTEDVDWYVSKKAIYLDGSGFLPKSRAGLPKIQQVFYRFLKKRSRRKQLKGIVLVLPMNEINGVIHEGKKARWQYWQKQLQEVRAAVNQELPLFVVVNQCDLVSGFQAFFQDLGREERWQPWGIPLEKAQGKKIRESFLKEFDQLVARLHQWLIWRLQHENSGESRVLINYFPLQFSQLKSDLVHFISAITSEKLPVVGLFFTSAIQQVSFMRQEQLAEEMPSSSSHFLMQIQKPQNKGYFIHDLLNHFLLKDDFLFYGRKAFKGAPVLLRKGVGLLAAGVILTAGVLCVLDFKKQVQTLNEAQRAVVNYQESFQARQTKEMTFQEKLAALHSLQAIIFSLHQRALPLATWIGPQKKINFLRSQASSTYNQMLQNLLLPMVLQDFSTSLTSNTISNEDLYKTLKAYLMLGNARRYQPKFLFSALQLVWRAQSIEAQRVAFMPYLKDMFEHLALPVPLDAQSVAAARKQLSPLPPPELSYLIFDDLIPNQQMLTLSLNRDKLTKVFSFRSPAVYIPSQYTAQVTLAELMRLATQSVREAMQGNWVTGMHSARPASVPAIDANSLRQGLLQHYYEEYARAWMNYLNNISVVEFSSLSDLNQALQLLTNQQNPLLWQVFRLIGGNLKVEALNANPQLNEFVHVVDRGGRYSLPVAIKALSDLHEYLVKMMSADHTGSEIFDMAVYRLKNHGYDDPITHLRELTQNYPEPMRSWLFQVSMQAWHLLLVQSQDYINQRWQEEIVPQYRAQIQNRFPFSSVATMDVSLDSFSYFFAPTGLLDNFISKYLKPFIDTTQMIWKTKTLDGKSLALPNNILANLQSVYQIQQLFFKDKDLQLSAPFDLQLVNFEDNVRTMAVQLGDQRFVFQKVADTYSFHWPDEGHSANAAKIVFSDRHGNPFDLTATGTWAWFKLLRQASMTKDTDKQSYQVIFDKEGLSAHLTMTFSRPNSLFSIEQLFDWRVTDNLF